ncbi:hypothetical protein [Faecalibaculum rodentium]|uniref:hypothetical protein n=1 Tax=Faecalibaculum rodentium TaxID=1702221 RepID=UPI0023F19B90|nr:hypothetical protein [Faecalibaculum rodentium]
MTQFEEGKYYYSGTCGRYFIVKRTAKTVTLKHYGKTKRYRIKTWPCGEVVLTGGAPLYASHNEEWRKRIAERETQEAEAAAAYRTAGEAADAEQFARMMNNGMSFEAAELVMNAKREGLCIC